MRFQTGGQDSRSGGGPGHPLIIMTPQLVLTIFATILDLKGLTSGGHNFSMSDVEGW